MKNPGNVPSTAEQMILQITALQAEVERLTRERDALAAFYDAVDLAASKVPSALTPPAGDAGEEG